MPCGRPSRRTARHGTHVEPTRQCKVASAAPAGLPPAPARRCALALWSAVVVSRLGSPRRVRGPAASGAGASRPPGAARPVGSLVPASGGLRGASERDVLRAAPLALHPASRRRLARVAGALRSRRRRPSPSRPASGQRTAVSRHASVCDRVRHPSGRRVCAISRRYTAKLRDTAFPDLFTRLGYWISDRQADARHRPSLEP